MKRMPSVPWSGAPSVTGMSAKGMAMRRGEGCCARAASAKGRAALASRAAAESSLAALGMTLRDDTIGAARDLLLICAIMSGPNTLTATEIAKQIDAGTLTAEAVIRAHLERIDKRDADVL